MSAKETENGIKKREEIMNAIKEYKKENEISPTVREIGDMVNLASSSTVHEHLKILVEKGYIMMNSKSPRSIRVLKYA